MNKLVLLEQNEEGKERRVAPMLHLALTVILSNNNSSMVPFIAHGLNEIVIRIEFGNVRDFVQTT